MKRKRPSKESFRIAREYMRRQVAILDTMGGVVAPRRESIAKATRKIAEVLEEVRAGRRGAGVEERR